MASDNGELYAVILAGGVGTRLWPRSRTLLPKQMLNLTGGRSMLQQTVDRIQELILPDHIWVMTNQEYVALAQRQLPGVPCDQIVGEPAPRGTAPAIGLGALHVGRIAPKGVMFALHADHHIADEQGFRDAMRSAAAVAREGWLVSLGVKPTRPESGYGYIELGESLGSFEGHDAYRVECFLEKPEPETARRFVESGRFMWNSGIFCWRVDVIRQEFERLLPEVYEVLDRIGDSLRTPPAQEVLEQEWAKLPPTITIDHGIMEHAKRVATVPLDAGWSDVGAWDSLASPVPGDDAGNSVTGRGDTIVLGSENVFVHSEERFVAVVGVKDLIVVDTGDALLVIARDRAQEVRHIVEYLQGQGRNELL
ncbi:MAG: mannose-1-phosphate guanylyltransferase [Ardenticatenaceae bacterium]